MQLFRLALALEVALSLCAARAVPRTHVLHEKRDASATSVEVKSIHLNANTLLPMRIGLKQRHLDTAHERLSEVSDPQSPKYGQHWTQGEVLEYFKPHDVSVEAVMAWLTSAGIGKHRIARSDNKQWLAFDATSEEVGNLLHTQFHLYEHPNGHAMAGCDEYHIPRHLTEHIDFIMPAVKRSFIDSRRREQRGLSKRSWDNHSPARKRLSQLAPGHGQTNLSACDQTITPQCLQALYSFSPQNLSARVSPNNSMGIFQENDAYSQEDLDSFFTNFTSYIPNGTHPVPNLIDGGEAPVPVSESGSESSLDFQVSISIIYPQTTTLYQTDDLYYAYGGNGSTMGIFNTFFDAIDGSYCTYSAYGETGNDPVLDPIYPDPKGYQGPLQCGVYKPTNIISISYGEPEHNLPAYYQRRQCNEFLKLGLQGVSVFVASGDTGVGRASSHDCLRNGTVFTPSHPGSCPYLTNIGATKVLPGKTVYDPESALDDPTHPFISSGGGFSNLFPVPDYQKSAVAKFFATADPPYPYYHDGNYHNSTSVGLYNRNGRGVPDVAANGANIAVYHGGVFRLVGGTSASAPIFAALMNRVVEERIKIGKGPVGFINPVLYQHPEVMNDIVNGSNPGCGTKGFSCAKGWDPVTGLGTPNYPKMLELFLELP